MGFATKYHDETMAAGESVDAWCVVDAVEVTRHGANVQASLWRSQEAFDAGRAPMVASKRLSVADTEAREWSTLEHPEDGGRAVAVDHKEPATLHFTEFFGNLADAGNHPHEAAERYLQAHAP